MPNNSDVSPSTVWVWLSVNGMELDVERFSILSGLALRPSGATEVSLACWVVVYDEMVPALWLTRDTMARLVSLQAGFALDVALDEPLAGLVSWPNVVTLRSTRRGERRI